MAYDSEDYVVTDLPAPTKLEPEVREVLIKARGFIEQGWCRNYSKKLAGSEQDSKFEYCVLGAVNEATGSNGLLNRAAEALEDALEMRRHDRNLVYFNDSQAADKAEILALFDAALEG